MRASAQDSSFTNAALASSIASLVSSTIQITPKTSSKLTSRRTVSAATTPPMPFVTSSPPNPAKSTNANSPTNRTPPVATEVTRWIPDQKPAAYESNDQRTTTDHRKLPPLPCPSPGGEGRAAG